MYTDITLNFQRPPAVYNTTRTARVSSNRLTTIAGPGPTSLTWLTLLASNVARTFAVSSELIYEI